MPSARASGVRLRVENTLNDSASPAGALSADRTSPRRTSARFASICRRIWLARMGGCRLGQPARSESRDVENARLRDGPIARGNEWKIRGHESHSIWPTAMPAHLGSHTFHCPTRRRNIQNSGEMGPGNDLNEGKSLRQSITFCRIKPCAKPSLILGFVKVRFGMFTRHCGRDGRRPRKRYRPRRPR